MPLRPLARTALASLILALACSFSGCTTANAPAKPLTPKTPAASPQFAAYQAYLWYVFHKIHARWQTALKENAIPASDKKLTVAFALSSSGQITRIVRVEGTAGKKEQEACVAAITESAPFPKWSQEMRTILGEEQVLAINFTYQ
ncbi:MAG: hypothetical protein JSS11_02045 [Verrucomicrobia bacterium]|nr:hypothetical protein [Verrucomicrobiota bacterium]